MNLIMVVIFDLFNIIYLPEAYERATERIWKIAKAPRAIVMFSIFCSNAKAKNAVITAKPTKFPARFTPDFWVFLAISVGGDSLASFV